MHEQQRDLAPVAYMLRIRARQGVANAVHRSVIAHVANLQDPELERTDADGIQENEA